MTAIKEKALLSGLLTSGFYVPLTLGAIVTYTVDLFLGKPIYFEINT